MPVQVSRNIRAGLGDEAEGIVEYLLGESDGLCTLCETALNNAVETCVADHIVPEAEGGETTRENLQLAHKWCNSVKQNYTDEQIKPYVKFAKRYQIAGAGLDYGEAITQLDMFEFEPQPITMTVGEEEDIVEFEFAQGADGSVPIYHEVVGERDFSFCYMEVPITSLFNDDDCQPRSLKTNHVRSIYFDLFDNPLNEPACCRVKRNNDGTTNILMFDGQHKTLSMLLHGRERVVVKIYLDMNIEEATRLINTIQNKIVKLKASAFEAMGKLAQEFQADYAGYADEAGADASEAGFIAHVDAARRARARDACWAAIVDEFLELQTEIMPWIRLQDRPVPNPDTYPAHATETVMKNKIAQGLMKKAPLDDVGQGGITRRVRERNNATTALNYWIAAVSTANGDNGNYSARDIIRISRNFRQTSLTFSMALIKRIIGHIMVHEPDVALLQAEPNEEQWTEIGTAIQKMVTHPAWRTPREYSVPAAELDDLCQLNNSITAKMNELHLTLNYCIVGELPDNIMQIQEE